MQPNMALQRNRPREPDPLGHFHPAAAFLHQAFNGIGKGLRVEGNSVANAAEVGKGDASVRYLRQCGCLHLKGRLAA